MSIEVKGPEDGGVTFSQRRPVWVTPEEFLRQIAKDHSILRIYYPGSSDDNQLEQPLGKERVVTLDRDRQRGMPNFVQGCMEHSPFFSEVFDAVFLQDVGANKEELTDILRTLHPNGIVIHSYSGCCDEDLPLLKKHPQLEPFKTPYYNRDLRVFRKLETSINNQK